MVVVIEGCVTSVFFEGFHDLVLCAKAVIYALLRKYPLAAVHFLLYQDLAKQCQVPIVSYVFSFVGYQWLNRRGIRAAGAG